MPFAGEAIAIATVICWTISVQFFGAASKMVGSTSVNIIRLAVALIYFGLFLFVRDHTFIPADFPPFAWWYLSLSGIVGFFIGDIFLFKALVELGPRVAMLIHSLAAPAAAIIGWLFLGETYIMHQWIGILVTMSGVALVLLERNNTVSSGQYIKKEGLPISGIIYGFAAMFGQAGGYVLSKAGMQTSDGYLDAFAATQIRVLAALACFVIMFSITGKWRSLGRALDNRRAVCYTVIGAFIGPFVGVSLSLKVLHYLSSGVAATFLSLVPIFIIPFSVFLYKERVSLRAVSGAFIAVFGIYLLMV